MIAAQQMRPVCLSITFTRFVIVTVCDRWK